MGERFGGTPTARRESLSGLRRPGKLWSNSLLRNGYLLTLSSGLTALVGVLYWTVAAWRYEPSSVGANSAALSLMMLMASVAQVNMSSVVVRFIPSAGERTRSLVTTAYLLCGGLAVLVGAGCVLAVRWVPSGSDFLDDPRAAVLFVLAIVAYTVFVLQDGLLVGLQRAALVPVKNVVFALMKLALVAGLATLLPWHGILASWTLALVGVIAVIGLFVARSAIPKHQQQSTGAAEPLPPVGQMIRYVAVDYAGAVCSIASIDLMPILVIVVLGDEQNAYFAIAWLISYSVHLININMGTSLVADAAADPAKLAGGAARVLRHTLKLLLPIVAVIVVGAPFILGIFGTEYRAASDTLRLLSLAALPHLVVAIAISCARARRQLRLLIGVQGLQFVVVLPLTWLLLQWVGATGPGWAWLITQSVLAAALLVGHRRWLPTSQSASGGVLTLWLVERTVRLLDKTQLRSPAERAVRRWRSRQQRDVPDELAEHEVLGELPNDMGAVTGQTVPTVSDVAVVILSDHRGPTAVLKYARGAEGAAELRTQRDVLERMRAEPGFDASWLALLPDVVAFSDTERGTESVERYVPGIDLAELLNRHPDRVEKLTSVALSALAPLHTQTATTIVVDDSCLLPRWVDGPVDELAQMCQTLDPRLLPATQALQSQLREALLGRRVQVGWTHGDYTPGNIRFGKQAGPVSGILDWGGARPGQLPAIDNYLLLLTVARQHARTELGAVVSARLQAGGLTANERRALGTVREGDGCAGDLDDSTAILLAWLHHTTDLWRKCATYRTHRVWWVNNIVPVLRVMRSESATKSRFSKLVATR